MELRLFNYLLPNKDMIQIPVYPYAPEWKGFTAGHYVDEFAENHGKDVIVREALTGQVPSAGVGTCFSRRAISALLEDGDGIAFDVQSLTEDYDIGFRLKQKGMKCIFARYSITDPALTLKQEWRPGMSREFSQVICVREHSRVTGSMPSGRSRGGSSASCSRAPATSAGAVRAHSTTSSGATAVDCSPTC